MMKALQIGAMGLVLLGAQASIAVAQSAGASTGASATATSGPSDNGAAPSGAVDSGVDSTPPAGPVAQGTGQQPAGTPTDASSPAGQATQVGAGTPESIDPNAAPDAATVAAAWEGPVPPAYIGGAPQMTPDEVTAWLANSRSLLDDNIEGGGEMVRAVRSLLGSDNRTVLPLVELVKQPDVRDRQVEAVAIGFSSAVRESETPAPEYAAYLQWAVAQSNSPRFIEAFEKASGADEEATAALGSNNGGPGSSPGSGSLSGAGDIGPSGPVGSVAQGVVQTAGVENSIGRRTISFDDNNRNRGNTVTNVTVTNVTSNPNPSTTPPSTQTPVVVPPVIIGDGGNSGCENDVSPAGCVSSN